MDSASSMPCNDAAKERLTASPIWGLAASADDVFRLSAWESAEDQE
jgi:hypothetical protein